MNFFDPILKMPGATGLLPLLLLFAGKADGTTDGAILLAPGEAAITFNGNSSARPFDIGPARFQQVYEPAAFLSILPQGGGFPQGGAFISELAFRVDGTLGHGFYETIHDLQINMSTVSRFADGLSGGFSDNVGNDDTVVLGPGEVQFDSLGSAAFDATIVLTTPFFYDPAAGNLLLDFRIRSGIGVGHVQGVAILDAFEVVGDSVSSVYAYSTSGGLPTSGQLSSLGLATLFVVTPVPEPASYALLALGAVLAFALRRNRNRTGGSPCR